MKKVSVIVPVYNTSLYLEECINSIINQTYKNLEIIVVNDCSTDNSLEIISKFKDKRIKIINLKKMVDYLMQETMVCSMQLVSILLLWIVMIIGI